MLFHQLIATASGLQQGGGGALRVRAELCVPGRDQVHQGANRLGEAPASAVRARDIISGSDRLRLCGEPVVGRW